MKTVKRYGWELARAGNWKASTGDGRITPDEITAMAKSANHPDLDKIKIKIGHAPNRPGEPAYGLVTNLRATDNRLVGDLEVPEEVDQLMQVAYPDRSIEFDRGVTTPDGTRHPAVLRRVALLGIEPPAVKGLNDLVPADVIPTSASETASGETVTIRMSASDTPSQPPTGVPGETRKDATPKSYPATKGATVHFTEQKLKELGLEGLTADQIAKLNSEATTVAKTAEDAAVTALAEAEKTRLAEADKAKAAADAAAKAPIVTLSQAQYDQLAKDAAAGAAAAVQLAETAKTGLLDTAIREGKIAPAERAVFAELPTEQLTKVIAGLTARIPTSEQGTGTNLSESPSEAELDAAVKQFFNR